MNTQLFRGLLDRCEVFEWPRFEQLVNQYADAYEFKQSLSKPIVVYCTGNPWDMDQVCDFLRSSHSNDIVQTVLVNDVETVRRHPDLKLCHFPATGIGMVEELRQKLWSGEISWDHRTHLVSCLNHQTKAHRLRLAQRLHSQNLVDRLYFSFAGYASPFVTQAGFEAEEWFHQNRTRFPIMANEWDPVRNDWDPFSPGFSDTYLNICTESSMENFCPTEKTWKHIIAGCLSITLASPLFCAKMRDIGFALEFDGIPIGPIDQHPNWAQRVDLAVDLLSDILDHIPDIWHLNLPKLKHNHEIMESGIWTKPFYDNLKSHMV